MSSVVSWDKIIIEARFLKTHVATMFDFYNSNYDNKAASNKLRPWNSQLRLQSDNQSASRVAPDNHLFLTTEGKTPNLIGWSKEVLSWSHRLIKSLMWNLGHWLERSGTWDLEWGPLRGFRKLNGQVSLVSSLIRPLGQTRSACRAWWPWRLEINIDDAVALNRDAHFQDLLLPSFTASKPMTRIRSAHPRRSSKSANGRRTQSQDVANLSHCKLGGEV